MTTKERIKGSYFGKTLDDGRNHLNKIRNLQLPIEEWAAFNHLAVFLRWMGEHNMLSERLLEDVSNINELINDKNTYLRKIIVQNPAFNSQIKVSYFNNIGRDFSKRFYTFGKAGYPSCVDQYAERYFGKDKYNCDEFKNEAYLFVPYDEEYYQGLSKYIDEAFEKYTKNYMTSSPFKYSEKFKILEAEIHGIRFVCDEIDVDKEMKAFELAYFYRKKLKVFVNGMMDEIVSFYGEMSKEDVIKSLGIPTIDLDNDIITYTEHTLDDIHVIDVEFRGIFDEILETRIDG